jgi:hypothetical protein
MSELERLFFAENELIDLSQRDGFEDWEELIIWFYNRYVW